MLVPDNFELKFLIQSSEIQGLANLQFENFENFEN